MTGVATVAPSLSPFPGLRPFRESETHLFFGRQGQTEELLRRLARSRFLAVLGTSGSGKSSLVSAGLMPALRGDYLVDARARWRIVRMHPGADPLARLANGLRTLRELGDVTAPDLRRSSMALAKRFAASLEAKAWDSDANLLLFVDQFEELFRYAAVGDGADWDARATFVNLLIEAARGEGLPLYVVITMRSEYLGDCAQFHGLPEIINEGQYLIPRLTREHWRSAIEGPVRLMDASVAPGLMQQLLNDVGRFETAVRHGDDSQSDTADVLPLLQHALNRTWSTFCARTNWPQAAPGAQLELDDYNQVGRIDEALSRHLDEAVRMARFKYGDSGELIAKHVFQRLRVRDPKGREVRDPVLFKQLCEVCAAPPDQVEGVVDCFRGDGQSFLTPEFPKDLAESDEIDVTHECLLRRWKKLAAEWIPEEEEACRQYLRLVQALDDGDPVPDARVEAIWKWWTRRRPNAAWAVRYGGRFAQAQKLLQRSVIEKRQRASEEEARVRAEERRRRKYARLKAGMAGLAAAMSLVLIGGVLLYRSSQRTDRSATEAFAQLLAAKAQLAASEESGPQIPALLALASIRHSEEELQGRLLIENRSVLAGAVSRLPLSASALDVSGPVAAMAQSNDRQQLAIAMRDGTVFVVDARDGLSTKLPGSGEPLAMTFSRDGRYLVLTTEGESEAIQIWDTTTRRRIAALPCPQEPTGGALLAPDDETLFAPCSSLMRWTSAAWRGQRPGTQVRWASAFAPVRALTFDAAGETLLVGAENEEDTIDVLLAVDWRRGVIRAQMPAGDVDLQRVVAVPPSHAAAVDEAGRVRLWNVDDPETPPVLMLHDGPVVEIQQERDTSRIVTVARTGAVTSWSLAGVRESEKRLGREVTHAMAQPPGELVAAGSDGRVTRWSLWGPGERQPLEPRVFGAVAIGGDRVFYESALFDFTSLDADGRTSQHDIPPVPIGFLRLFVNIRRAVSADGQLVAAALPGGVRLYSPGRDGSFVERWREIGDGSPTGSLAGYTVRTMQFSPDGGKLAILALRDGSQDLVIRVYGTADRPGGKWQDVPDDTWLEQVSSEGVLLLRSRNREVFAFDPGRGERRDIAGAAGDRFEAVVAFTRDSRLLAVAESAASVRGPSAGSGTSIRILNWPELTQVSRWNISGSVTLLAFSHRSGELTTLAPDGSMRVWSASTGTELARLPAEGSPAALAFSSDDTLLITSDRTTVRRYLWDVDDLTVEACRRVERNMTPAEWGRYVPEQFRETAEQYRCACPDKPCEGRSGP